MVSTAPYGAWRSPIDAALAAAHDGRPEFVGTVGDEVWWVTSCPAEGGRSTLVRRRSGGEEGSALAAPWNVRSRVMEYGGRPWAAVPRRSGGPLVVFVHFADQRLYVWEPDDPAGGGPRPLTPVSSVGGGLRWADPVLLPERGEVWCVLEEFTGEGPDRLRRLIAAVPLDGSAAGDRAAVRELTGDDSRFVTGPRLSPDGRRAAWLAWDHPRMPWEGTELKVAEVTEGAGGALLTGARTVLGGATEAVAQVEWAHDGSLLAVTDRTGWWNPYRVDPETGEGVNLCPREEEFAGALWRAGLSWFVPLAGGLVAVVHGRGAQRLGILDPDTGELVDAAGPWTEWAATLAADGSRVVGVAASPRSGYEVVELDIRTGRARAIGARHRDAVDPAYYPEPLIRTFTGPDGRDVHAHVYPPHSPDYTAPADQEPPFVVWAHGGPTGRAPLVLDLEIAYFTSRGIGVVQVNYGGSTGYGRAYRDRIRERWGVVDVEDCAAVAEALAEEGGADRARLAIRGGSAGGWTTAASLVSSDLYACGAICFPVLDLPAMAAGGTHDLESRYPEYLVGPFAEVPERYRERSPISRADRLTAAFLLLQGMEDPVCPPEQGERFLAAVEGRGVPHAYLAFEGEGHGLREQRNIVRALEAELSLYAQTFGMEVPGIPVLELVK
ncbi:S9 family peptidase [Streptomyces luteoverticillatus]|uniref:S9 family peptidase n=1 Tax=Streptomyces luteoverticillatus TaxID=66425 RepID=A0A3S9PPI0_STRLT|nr:LpqB family beta-propeller domain-containing protein [Streptomyces luteoverticillatus]AZQ74223.1 S9 family peptidase [Streptomyces luteoverticillatus]